MKHITEIVSTLFLSREQAHRAHFSTKSGFHHMVLGDFYAAVIELADRFAETAQGTYGRLPEIPFKSPTKGQIADVLETQIECVEDQRSKFDKPCDGPLLAIIDEIGELYASTLNKLRNYS